jgi:uncharacterized protein
MKLRSVKQSLLSLFVLLPVLCAAAIQFPSLSGRVVDNAGLLNPDTEQALTEKLAAHEKATTNQIVVVTLKNLQGYTIEEFGYQLGRHWGIGQKGKDNGVLLIVVPTQRELRIEVGYGLEGELTDATASNIIQGVIVPRFKHGDFEGGITEGVSTIIQALSGAYILPASFKKSRISEPMGRLLVMAIITLIVFIMVLIQRKGGSSGGGRSWGGGRSGGGGGSSGRSSGRSSSGGGGSFGGGGASGRW